MKKRGGEIGKRGTGIEKSPLKLVKQSWFRLMD